MCDFFVDKGKGCHVILLVAKAYNRPPSHQQLISFDSIKKEIFNIWVEVIRFVDT